MTRDRLGCLFTVVVAAAILFVGWLMVEVTAQPTPAAPTPTLAVVVLTQVATAEPTKMEQSNLPTPAPEPILTPRPTATSTPVPTVTPEPTVAPEGTQKPMVQRG